MCVLVIVFALALIKTGTGAVDMSDNTIDTDNRIPEDVCLYECVPRCQHLAKTPCCKCVSLCVTFCKIAHKTSSTPIAENIDSNSQALPCAELCDLPVVKGQRPTSHRTKRRPSRSPMMREAAIIARSVGMDLGPLDSGFEETRLGRQMSPRLMSLIQEEDVVTAVVSWDPLGSPELPSGSSWYLVTWEPEGDGVRGNLLVNSTSTSLSLWPGAVYHIQVSSTSSKAASSCLEVDTRSSLAPPGFTQGSTRDSSQPRVEVLAGVAAAVVLFLVTLLSALRRRKALELSSKNIERSHHDFDRFSVYPPPVTLRHLSEEKKTTLQLAV